MTDLMQLRTRITKATGLDLWPADLLVRLIHWHKYSKVEEFGCKWVVRTLSEWTEEIGIKSKAYKRAIRILREQGFVVTRIAPHPFKKTCLRSTFYTLTEHLSAFVSESQKPWLLGSGRPDYSGQNDRINRSLSTLSSIYNTNLSSIFQPDDTSGQTPRAENQNRKSSPEDTLLLSEMDELETDDSASDVASPHSSKPP